MRNIKEQTFEWYLENPDLANWHDISSNKNLTIDQIRRAKDYLDWYWISLHYSFTEDQIRQFADYIYWDWLSFKNKKISISLLREYRNYIQSWDFLNYVEVPKDFRRQFEIKEITPYTLTQYNEKEIGEFIYGKKWDSVSKNFWLNQDIIEKYKDKLNWYYLQRRGTFTIKLLWNMRNYVDWKFITRAQAVKWKEYRLNKFQKYLDWDEIKTWTWKKWSKSFKKKFGKRLELN